MKDYWRDRLRDALRNSLAAPSPAVRAVHLDSARHYRSLLLCSPAARAGEPSSS